jgi:hypothetical protein
MSQLNPNPGGDSPIRPLSSRSDRLTRLRFDFDCVFLCNAPLTANEADRLFGAESGGGIVIFLGDRIIPRLTTLVQTGTGVCARRRYSRPLGPIVAQPQLVLIRWIIAIRSRRFAAERAGLLTTLPSLTLPARCFQQTAGWNRRRYRVAIRLL